MKYFASVGYAHEGSIFKGVNDGKIDSRYYYNRFNFRTNVDFNVTPTTVVSFKLGGNVGIKNKPQPQDGDDGMWKYIFGSSTAKYPMYYPSWVLEEVPDLDYPGVVEDRLISEADQTTGNPYYQMMRGRFIQLTDSKLFSDIILNQKLDFITKGLSVQGKVSLSTYYKYTTLRTEYDRPAWYLDFSKIGSGENPWRRTGDNGYLYVPNPVYTTAGNALQDGYYLDLYYDLSLNYNRTFGRHNVTGLVLFNRQEQDKGSDFPYYNEAIVARATYDFAHKYLVEVNMGYTGSERFAPGNRFGFFPSGAVGWVVSEERFFEPLKPWFSKLKLRYSQGLVGSDYANNRWLYMSEFSKDGNGHIVEDKIANSSVQWEQAMKRDLGIEMGFLNDELHLSVDLFDEKRDKMLISVDNTTPMWIGNTSKELNKGKIKKHGIELELSYRKQLNKDWTVFLGGNFSFNENPHPLRRRRPLRPRASAQGRHGPRCAAQRRLPRGQRLSDLGGRHPQQLPARQGQRRGGRRLQVPRLHGRRRDRQGRPRTHGGFAQSSDRLRLQRGLQVEGPRRERPLPGLCQEMGQFRPDVRVGVLQGQLPHAPLVARLLVAVESGRQPRSRALHRLVAGQHELVGLQRERHDGGYNAKIAGRSWRRADYLRLKEVSVGYTWSGPKIRQALGVRALKVYATGNNLLTFTDLLEGDPENKYLVWGQYPQMMTVKLGIQVSF